MSAAISIQVRADTLHGEAMTVADMRAWLAKWDQLIAQRVVDVDDSLVTCRTNASGQLIGLSAVIPPGDSDG